MHAGIIVVLVAAAVVLPICLFAHLSAPWQSMVLPPSMRYARVSFTSSPLSLSLSLSLTHTASFSLRVGVLSLRFGIELVDDSATSSLPSAVGRGGGRGVT